MPSARAVIDALLPVLQADLAGVEAMAKLASDEATSADNRAENKYDTRSLEASYLARGQAERVVALRRAVSWLQAFAPPGSAERVGLGTVVHVDADGTEKVLFLVPDEGGRTVHVDGQAVQTVTPKSPLARVLLGLEAGEAAELRSGGREIEIEILSVEG